MMEMVDAYGHHIFETIKITLVCDDCLRTDHPERCRHKLASMPRWLSSKKVETVRALLAEDPVSLDTFTSCQTALVFIDNPVCTGDAVRHRRRRRPL